MTDDANQNPKVIPDPKSKHDVPELEQDHSRLPKLKIEHTPDDVTMTAAPTSQRWRIPRRLGITRPDFDAFWRGMEKIMRGEKS